MPDIDAIADSYSLAAQRAHEGEGAEIDAAWERADKGRAVAAHIELFAKDYLRGRLSDLLAASLAYAQAEGCRHPDLGDDGLEGVAEGPEGVSELLDEIAIHAASMIAEAVGAGTQTAGKPLRSDLWDYLPKAQK